MKYALVMFAFLVAACCGDAPRAPAVTFNPLPDAVNYPPVEFSARGTGTNFTRPVALHPGMLTVSIEHDWEPGESEHFAVWLRRVDGSAVLGGLLANTTHRHDEPAETFVSRQMIHVGGTSEYVFQVEGEGHGEWRIEARQQ